MELFTSPSDPVSKVVAALKGQASTPCSKSQAPPVAKPPTRPLLSKRNSRNLDEDYSEHSMYEEVSTRAIEAPNSSSKVRFSKAVNFSPSATNRRHGYRNNAFIMSGETPASPEPNQIARSPSLRSYRSPLSPYTPIDLHACTPLTISPSSTVKRALCEQWDQYNADYKDAIQEHEIQYKARIQSVRNITGVTVALFILYLAIGSCYYSIWSTAENKWPLHESLIFLIYTCSTVGYGNHDIPSSPIDRVVTIAIIMIGIGLVTVLLSEIFQYMTIVTEKARFTHEERKISMKANCNGNAMDGNGSVDEENQETCVKRNLWEHSFAHKFRSAVFDTYNFWRYTLERNTAWRYFVKCLPFVFLIVLGASVVGSIEGWTWIDSLYWATVTLTTVGYGDLVPTKPMAIWFCIFYLPTATIFLSLYLSKIAGMYMRLHVAQINRVESRLEIMYKNKDEKDRWPVLNLMPSGETDESLPIKEGSTGSPDSTSHRMKTPSPSSLNARSEGDGKRANTTSKKDPKRPQLLPHRDRALSMRDLLKSTKTNKMKESTRNILADVSPTPSLGLRARVQERIAYIVATEFCREGPKIELHDNEIHLVLPDWKKVVEKWMIPKKAKEPLKCVSCEIILSVGITDIQERGVNSLLELNTSHFQRSFNPVIAAFGHADCMEGWMIGTDHLVKTSD